MSRVSAWSLTTTDSTPPVAFLVKMCVVLFRSNGITFWARPAMPEGAPSRSRTTRKTVTTATTRTTTPPATSPARRRDNLPLVIIEGLHESREAVQYGRPVVLRNGLKDLGELRGPNSGQVGGGSLPRSGQRQGVGTSVGGIGQVGHPTPMEEL